MQADAARRLAITKPRLNAPLNGGMSKFSPRAPTDLAATAGLGITVKLGKRPRAAAADYGATHAIEPLQAG